MLSKYTTTAMTAVRICSLNAWYGVGVVLALLDQEVRLYAWCVLEFDVVVRVRCSMRS